MSVINEILTSETTNKDQKYINIMKIEARYIDGNDIENKKRTLEYIANECDLNKFEKKEALDIIDRIINLKTLCKNCSTEQIISVICLRTKNKYHKIEMERYRIWKEYNLSWKRYITISDRIGDYFYKHTYLKQF